MLDAKFIEDIVRRLSDSLPAGNQSVPSDPEKNFRSILQVGLSKLDLVSRDEFDIQTRLLERTREKIDRLEGEIRAIEDKE